MSIYVTILCTHKTQAEENKIAITNLYLTEIEKKRVSRENIEIEAGGGGGGGRNWCYGEEGKKKRGEEIQEREKRLREGKKRALKKIS